MTEKRLNRWLDWLIGKPLRRLHEKPEKILKRFVTPGMVALDVGCGEGPYSLGLAKLVGTEGRVVAVDMDETALAKLAQRAARAGLAGLIETRSCTDRDLAVGDLEGRVDFALAVYVVHHARDVARLMGDVRRALRPGGVFLIVEPRHHASASECADTEAAALEAGFVLDGHPRFVRDWTAQFRRI